MSMSMINEPVPHGCGTGLIPRNFQTHPEGYLGAFAEPYPNDSIIPPDQWSGILANNRATKSGLLDLREANYDILKSLNQLSFGLCWSFSSTKAVMYLRALMGGFQCELSAWYVAGNINNWADRGGWGASSLEFIVKNGIPSIDKCPSYSRSAVTSDASQNALLHKVTEWWDGSSSPSTAQQQLVSNLLRKIPCVVDLNVMGHSMCAIDIDSLSPLTIVYDNSWSPTYGDRGLYRGTGAYARPDGLVIPRVTLPSIA